MKQNITLGTESREKLLKGINKIGDTVSSTLGPAGRNIIYFNGENILTTKDGVTVAKSIKQLEDPIENMGAQLIKQASIKTVDNVGDGTTTSTLLAQEMINEGIKYLNNNINVIDLKNGINNATETILNELKHNISRNISSNDQLLQIATISSNNDPYIGNLIHQALESAGSEGVVYVEESKSGETYLENVEGIQFDRGYKSHYFVTDNNTMTCTLNDVVILIADQKLSQVKELLPILEAVSAKNKSLLIIAEDIDHEALAALIVNKVRGILKVCAVKAPDFGDRRKLLLEDIAILTGGEVFSPNKGMKLDKFNWDWFGNARIATINKENTTIIDGNGNETNIDNRINELKHQIETSSSLYEKEKLQERLSKFAGGISIIHVGGGTETEMKETKDRVDDALYATKAALTEGIVPGGGSALIFAREAIKFNKDNISGFEIGKKIVYNACLKPFIKILENAGYDFTTSNNFYYNIIKKDKNKKEYGVNIKDGNIINMFENGIIDPTKVTRNALKNASSVATMVLLTEGVVYDIESNEKENNNPMDLMNQFG
jgi:chaperonin GroEL